jgi:hypothetical protein
MDNLTNKQFKIFEEWKSLSYMVQGLAAAFQNDFEIEKSPNNAISTAIYYNDELKEVKNRMNELHTISTDFFQGVIEGTCVVYGYENFKTLAYMGHDFGCGVGFDKYRIFCL